MTRVFNFSPGPSQLPDAVLQRAAGELMDWQGLGHSVLEMSHRAPAFAELNARVHQKIRQLLSVPEAYHVLLLPGGARVQFSILPQNILGARSRPMDYVLTGLWSQLAFEEGQRLGDAHCVASSKAEGYHHIPAFETWQCREDAAFLHYTPNETVHGVAFPKIPKVGDVPLIADMTSCLFMQSLDIHQFGAIYASTQKNAGLAGMSIVIIRKDLLAETKAAQVPLVLDYATQAKAQSLYSTPPNAAIYFLDLMLDWMMELGGMPTLERLSVEKSALLYAFIDQCDFYHNPVDPPFRSPINVPFVLREARLTETFLTAANAAKLVHLKGHWRVGGVRANLYNAVSLEAVHALIQFMRDFADKHGG